MDGKEPRRLIRDHAGNYLLKEEKNEKQDESVSEHDQHHPM